MRLPPPRVPPAASALFGAAFGPRVPPGKYTVRMTKGDEVLSTSLEVALDPRATYTVEDRKAQFELVTRLSAMLNRMTSAVEAIVALRDQASERAAKLGTDPLAKRLQALAQSADTLRGKIVATKEGGMITGEERLREFMGGLYGDVNSYEGRPSTSQVEQAAAVGREQDAVVKGRLVEANRALAGKRLEPVRVPEIAEGPK